MAMAYRKEDLDLAALLAEHGANGTDALLVAAGKNDTVGCLFALAAGANVNVTVDGKPLLSVAAVYGHVNVVRLFLERGADPNLADGSGITTLGRLIRRGGTEEKCLFELLEHGADANTVRPDAGTTPLHDAVIKNDMTAATVLLSDGARVKAACRGSGYTALHLASSEEMRNLLLAAGATRGSVGAPASAAQADLAVPPERAALACVAS